MEYSGMVTSFISSPVITGFSEVKITEKDGKSGSVGKMAGREWVESAELILKQSDNNEPQINTDWHRDQLSVLFCADLISIANCLKSCFY